VVVGSVLAAFPRSSAAVDPGHAEVQRVLDRAVAEAGAPGIVAEVRDGQTSWFGSAGVADTETGRARVRPDRFRIGSTSKTFTAIVILQLAAERRLRLDDPVERWLPGVVQGHGHDGSRITIRQLLNQTSGIFNYTMDPEALSRFIGHAFLEHRYDSYRPEQLVQIAMSHPPTFEPGTSWAYSNTNYILAGMIIERVTGRAFADQVSRRIIGPLGLTGTYVPGDDPALPRPHGRHYSKLLLPDPDAPVYDVTEMNPSTAWAAGGMVSTAGDLNRFFSALLGGRLLPPDQQREMFITVSTDGAGWIPDTRYGLGVFSQTLPCGVTVWGNGGAIHGSWSYAMGSRDGRRLVSQNINGDWLGLGIFNEVLQAEFCPGPD
jgi:D-alanyl-D-alanine carboxypeptidase